VEKLAVLAFGENEENLVKVTLLDRNTSKPLLTVRSSKERHEDFYGMLKNAEVDCLTQSLQELLVDEEMAGRFCYVNLPDSLVIYKCFKRNVANLPNFKQEEEREEFKALCLKENPDKKPLDNYQVAIMGVTTLGEFAYINVAYVLKATIQALQGAFARNKMAVLAIEPNFNGLRRILRLHFPTQPCIFSQGSNYFWTNQENIFSLNTVEEDETTNYQVLMAMRQKVFDANIPWDKIAVVSKNNLQLMPKWIVTEDAEKDYLTLCSLGSGLRGMKIPGKDAKERYGIKKLRQLFSR